MARGNQREISREKNLARQAQKQKQQGKEGNPLARNLNDSAALAAKVAAKQAKLAEEQAKGPVPVPVERKKVPKVVDSSLDDLLNAGLSKAKKK